METRDLCRRGHLDPVRVVVGRRAHVHRAKSAAYAQLMLYDVPAGSTPD